MPLFGRPGEGIAYAVYGSGPPLVLLHGFTASSATFSSNIPRLSGRFTVIAVDLLGHGGSDAPEDPDPYRPGPAVTRVIELMDELGHDEFLLCGHSLGGALALRIALEHPDRVAGLVVINSNSAAGKPAWRGVIRPRMQSLADRIRAEGPAFLTHTRLYPGRSSRLPPEAREQLARDFESLQPAGIAGTAEALVVDVNAWERLSQLSVPTLVVIGDRDRDFAAAVDDFVAEMPARLVSTVTLAGAGHAANLEQPEEFCAAVLLFAADIDYLGGRGPRVKGSAWLTLLGVGLVSAGAALVLAALLVGGDGETPSAAPETTPRQQVAGAVAGATHTSTSAATPSLSSPTLAAVATPAASATPTAAVGAAVPPPTTLATSTGSPSPTSTRPATATATPPPATVPPTATTPAGPTARISGPTRVTAGVPATFVDSSTPVELALTNRWTSTNGQTATAAPFFSVTFANPGECHVISLTVYFPGLPGPVNTTHKVAVGNAVCP